MEFKQLEIYVKAYELKSFSKTAEEIYLSQPSISAHISSLEKELNTQLIHRSNKEFLPTKAGKLFYEQAREMLANRDKSIKKIKSMSGATSGCIDILSSSVPAQYILPKILSAYHKIYPNVSFNVRQADTQRVIDGVSANECELGFAGSLIDSSSKCIYKDLASERLILIAPYEQRYKGIDKEEVAHLLRTEFFVMRESGSGTRQEYEEYLRNLGIKASELKISAYFNSTQSIIQAVSGGLGLSIVSELAANQYIQSKAIIPLYVQSPCIRHFYMVLRKNYALSALTDLFVKFTQDFKL